MGRDPSGRRPTSGAAATVFAVACCLLVVTAAAPVVQAAHNDYPNFYVTVPDPTVEPGTTTELTVMVENDARQTYRAAYTATQVRATMSSESAIVVESGTQVVEPISDGEVVPVTFTIRVPRNIQAGEYELPIRFDYEYTEHNANKSGTDTVRPTVRVDERARFAVVGSGNNVSVGERGTVNVTVENRGEAAAADATMTLASRSAAVTVGGAESDQRYLGRLEPGERQSVAYQVSIDGDADTQSFALSATIDYEDAEGVARTSPTMAVELTPRVEQEFDVESADASLRVGEEGTVEGRVVNRGPSRVTDAVAALTSSGSNLDILEPEYVLGSLEPGESAPFSFDVEVSEAAGGGPRQFALDVRYRNPGGDRRTSESLDVNVEVAPSRDVFDVEPASATIEAGGSGRLVLSVRNAGDEPVTDVSAKLFANAPLSSANDEAFVDEITPGETAEFVFQVGSAAGVLPKTYPVSVDFQYDDADGDTLLSDTYRVPVTVVEPEGGGGPPFVPIAVGVLVVLGGAAYILRRRGRWPPWR